MGATSSRSSPPPGTPGRSVISGSTCSSPKGRSMQPSMRGSIRGTTRRWRRSCRRPAGVSAPSAVVRPARTSRSSARTGGYTTSCSHCSIRSSSFAVGRLAAVAVCAWLRAMSDRLALEPIAVGEADPRGRRGGAGPPGEALARVDAKFALSWWHWFYFGQTTKPAEPVFSADPDGWYRIDRRFMDDEAYDDLQRALHDPAVVHAMLEDYRAGLGVDRANDDRDRVAGLRVTCPTLLVWATRDDMESLYGDPVAVWRGWAEDVRGLALDSGHHMAEEVPEELSPAIASFLLAGSAP